jgi:hypothetical protein
MYKWFERFYYVIITQYNFLLAHNIFVHTLRVITVAYSLISIAVPGTVLLLERIVGYAYVTYHLADSKGSQHTCPELGQKDSAVLCL